MARLSLFVFAVLIGCLASPAQAQVAQADRAEIERAIRDQIDAFRRDAAEEAFAFAAPAIRERFGDAERFMAMVRKGFAPVYRPRAVSMGVLRAFNDGLAQEVFLVGPTGAAYVALYPVERQPDGSWKIAGCYLSKRAEQAI